MLHTLRRTIGDESFFGLARDWIARHSGGTASTADFVALASCYSRDDLRPLFSAWLDARRLPKLPRVG
jgi:aminopeptidase N